MGFRRVMSGAFGTIQSDGFQVRQFKMIENASKKRVRYLYVIMT